MKQFYKQSLRPSLQAFGVVVILDLLILASGLFSRAAMSNSESDFLTVSSFYFRLLTGNLFVVLAIATLHYLFKVRRNLIFFATILAYALIYPLLGFPQVFLRLFALFPVLSFIPNVIHFALPTAIAVAFVIFLWIEWLSAAGKKSYSVIGVVGVTAVLGFYFFKIQDGLLGFTAKEFMQTVERSPSRPNIIFLAVDSVRGDSPIFERAPIGSALREFGNTSLRYEHVITPRAETLPSLVAMLTGSEKPGANVEGRLDDSLFAQLKSLGYKTSFLNDGISLFTNQNVFDKNLSLKSGAPGMVGSVPFHSFLYYGFLNNTLGAFLMPELNSNQPSNGMYRFRNFTQQVQHEVRTLAAAPEPFVLLAHCSALDWSLNSMFPNRHLRPQGGDASTNAVDPLVNANQQHYERTLEIVTEGFLEPILTDLQSSDLMKNSVVVLVSIYGENCWHDGSQPRKKIPEHGRSFIFGADSEQTLLALHLPGIAGEVKKQTIGLIDILPTILDFLKQPFAETAGRSVLQTSNSKATYYAETGTWPAFGTRDLVNFFMSGEVGNDAVKANILKQRALYDGSFKLIFYPTLQGMQIFLCEFALDPLCRKNLADEQSERLKQMTNELLRRLNVDVEKGFFPPLVLKRGPRQARLEFSLNDKQLLQSAEQNIVRGQWVLMLRALELIYRWDERPRGFALLKWLQAHSTSREIRTRAESIRQRLFVGKIEQYSPENRWHFSNLRGAKGYENSIALKKTVEKSANPKANFESMWNRYNLEQQYHLQYSMQGPYFRGMELLSEDHDQSKIQALSYLVNGIDLPVRFRHRLLGFIDEIFQASLHLPLQLTKFSSFLNLFQDDLEKPPMLRDLQAGMVLAALEESKCESLNLTTCKEILSDKNTISSFPQWKKLLGAQRSKNSQELASIEKGRENPTLIRYLAAKTLGMPLTQYLKAEEHE